MSKKIPLCINSILMIYALLLIPLIYTHTCTFYNITFLFASLLCCCITGGVLLMLINIRDLLLPISHTILCILFGALVFSMALFISPNVLFLDVLMVLTTVILFILLKQHISITLKPDKPSIYAFLITIIGFILVSPYDLPEQFSQQLAYHHSYATDPYYFTSIVASIRRGSIFNAAYEVNTPLNYQILGFLIPSLLADVLQISSHQALWGIAHPFYKFLDILLCYEVCYFFMKDKVQRTDYRFMLMATLFSILLRPLHLYYVYKRLVTHNTDIFSDGLLIAHSTVTWPITIALLLLCILLFSKIDWKNKKITPDKVFFTVVLSIMVAGKVSLYFTAMTFFAIIILKRIIIDKEKIMNYLGYVLGSIFISYALYILCYNQFPLHIQHHFRYGYYASRFSRGFKRTNSPILNNIIIIGLILYSYLSWLSIRILGLIALYRYKNQRLRELLTSSLATLAAITILVSFLHIAIVDGSGKVLLDLSFDVLQFIMSSFYILTLISTIGLLFILYNILYKRAYKVLFLSITGIFCLISLTYCAYDYYVEYHSSPLPQYSWYNENYKELQTGKYNDGLITVNPALSYYGVMLAGSDAGRYWTAMDQSESNPNFSLKNEYRWILFKNLLANPEEKYLIQMKNEGVKYIISTPLDSMQLANISTIIPQHLQKIATTKWIYQVH